MTRQAILDEILKLSPEDRLDLLGDAWDAMAHEDASIPVPDWHIRELDRRLSHPNPQFTDWEDLDEELRGGQTG